ncbi:phosphopantetheine-binding protein [Jatrophihabitans endophyticus]|uniref:phosphopantetheine-binding protein n=1 Tax=Jatrophihabitans endophyticus TaxID=1206085 RepID=UPI00190EB403|nr:phosphopantetheine-binding protein [Jatrophihabitans endophyticus]
MTAKVLPDVDTSGMTIDGTLSDLGANSIDRADIATMAMMELGVKVPAREFAGVKDIGTLVDVLLAQLP